MSAAALLGKNRSRTRANTLPSSCKHICCQQTWCRGRWWAGVEGKAAALPRSFPSAQVSADADYGLSCIELERLRCSAGLPSSVQHLCQQQMCLGGGSRTPQHNVTSLPPMRGFHTWCAGAQSRSSNSSVDRSIKLLLQLLWSFHSTLSASERGLQLLSPTSTLWAQLCVLWSETFMHFLLSLVHFSFAMYWW